MSRSRFVPDGAWRPPRPDPAAASADGEDSTASSCERCGEMDALENTHFSRIGLLRVRCGLCGYMRFEGEGEPPREQQQPADVS